MTDGEKQSIPIRHVVAVVAGNGLEFYDFLTYSFFAVYIGRAFFPPGHGALGLLLTLATFAIGFVTRPLGALVLGSLGDRVGRKAAMMISFVLMGVGMAGTALTPGYASIGIAAPLLILLFRLIQGFALGGEVGPTTAYMFEAAPSHRRGLYGVMQGFSQNFAVLAAAMVGLLLSHILSPDQLQAYGWRVAFLIGLVIVPFSIWVRSGLPETFHAGEPAAPLRPQLRTHARAIMVCFVLLLAGTISSYSTDYMTTYAMDTLHLPPAIAFGLTVMTGGLMMLADVAAGMLSDRFGRRAVIIVPQIVHLLLILPGFWLIAHYRSAGVLYGVMAAICIPSAVWSDLTPMVLTEALPSRIRSGVVATTYAVAISVFGGTTQFVITALLKWTGNPLAPAWYWSGAMLLAIIATAFLRETAPCKANAPAPGGLLQPQEAIP